MSTSTTPSCWLLSAIASRGIKGCQPIPEAGRFWLGEVAKSNLDHIWSRVVGGTILNPCTSCVDQQNFQNSRSCRLHFPKNGRLSQPPTHCFASIVQTLPSKQRFRRHTSQHWPAIEFDFQRKKPSRYTIQCYAAIQVICSNTTCKTKLQGNKLSRPWR